MKLSIISWVSPLDHVLENNRTCLKDISQINNSTECRQEEYTDTTECLSHSNRDIMQLKFGFLKEPLNYTILGNDVISSLGEKERAQKKKGTFMTSCFHRASVPHQDQMCTVPTVNKTGKFFGKELSSISHNGEWPKAILVSLTWFISGSHKKIW